MFKYHNENPLGREVNDCVVRAIALATERSWDEVYDELSELARIEGTLLDDSNFVESYLNDRYNKVCFKRNGFRIDLNEFKERYPIGTYLVTMKGHITCVVDGKIHDIWNCGDKKIWCAWKVV